MTLKLIQSDLGSCVSNNSSSCYVTAGKNPLLLFHFRAAGLFFFSAFLINLLAGIVFLLGSNLAIVCDDVPNYKLLQKVSLS